ncbi:MAG: PD40 domain-containing protein [Opitutaceae bacterium]|nr:PD40 domain-containing protein [Opitutaceae bacterium]
MYAIVVATSLNALALQDLAFSSNRTGRNQIFTVRIDPLTGIVSGTPTQLTFGGAGSQETRSPSWSGSAFRLLFQFGASGVRGIHVIGETGGIDTRLTTFTGDERDPSWHPHGRFFVYSRLVSGTYDIWVHDTKGTYANVADDTDAELFAASGQELRPAWSPDGNTVAFAISGGSVGSDSEIAVLAVAVNTTAGTVTVSGPAQLLTMNLDEDTDPAWAPDSQSLAYTSLKNGNRDIYRMSSTQGELDAGTNIRLTQNPADDRNPSWSPDGQLVAFASERDGNREIYVTSADLGEAQGSVIQRVTNDAGTDDDPEFRPTPMYPVIFVPGIAATALHTGGSLDPNAPADFLSKLNWPYAVANAWDIFLPDVTTLQFGENGLPANQDSQNVSAAGLMDLPSEDFWDLIRYLEIKGYQRGRNLFILPYDWRYPVTQNAQELQNLIDTVTQDAPRAQLICHSMGGLLGKEVLRSSTTADKVECMIMLGTPHLGAPAAFQALRYGYNFGTDTINPYRAKRASHNMPGVYDLLPSAAYIQAESYLIADMDGDGIWDIVHDPATVLAFLQSWIEVINPLDPSDPNPRDRMNSLELIRSDQFHAALDSWTKPAKVRVYMLMGFNQATPYLYAETPPMNGIVGAIAYFTMRGDSTVTMTSGDHIANQTDAMYWVDMSSNLVTGINHGGYGSYAPVQVQVLQLLNGNEAPVPGPVIYIDRTQLPIEGCTQTRTFSPVMLDFVDLMGRHVGRDAQGIPEIQIPGAAFVSLGSGESVDNVAIPEGVVGEFVITPKVAGGSYTLAHSQVNSRNEVVSTIVFESVPFLGGEKFYLGQDQDGELTPLRRDADGDGIGDVDVPPSLVDVSPSIVIGRSGFRYNRATRRYIQKIALRNIGISEIEGPLSVLLDNLSAGCTADNIVGVSVYTEPPGTPYVAVDIGDDNALRAGETVTIDLSFSVTLGSGVAFRPRVMAGSGTR